MRLEAIVRDLKYLAGRLLKKSYSQYVGKIQLFADNNQGSVSALAALSTSVSTCFLKYQEIIPEHIFDRSTLLGAVGLGFVSFALSDKIISAIFRNKSKHFIERFNIPETSFSKIDKTLEASPEIAFSPQTNKEGIAYLRAAESAIVDCDLETYISEVTMASESFFTNPLSESRLTELKPYLDHSFSRHHIILANWFKYLAGEPVVETDKKLFDKYVLTAGNKFELYELAPPTYHMLVAIDLVNGNFERALASAKNFSEMEPIFINGVFHARLLDLCAEEGLVEGLDSDSAWYKSLESICSYGREDALENLSDEKGNIKLLSDGGPLTNLLLFKKSGSGESFQTESDIMNIIRKKIPNSKILVETVGNPSKMPGGYMVMKKILGKSASELDQAGLLDSKTIGRIVKTLAEFHVEMSEGLGFFDTQFFGGSDFEDTFIRKFYPRFKSLITEESLFKITNSSSYLGQFMRTQTKYVIHGDFHPGNVIISEESVKFIDIESVSLGSVQSDLAKFLNFNLLKTKIDTQKFLNQYYDYFCDLRGTKVRNPSRELFLKTWYAASVQVDMSMVSYAMGHPGKFRSPRHMRRVVKNDLDRMCSSFHSLSAMSQKTVKGDLSYLADFIYSLSASL